MKKSIFIITICLSFNAQALKNKIGCNAHLLDTISELSQVTARFLDEQRNISISELTKTRDFKGMQAINALIDECAEIQRKKDARKK